jgi:hypothetical protein
MLFKITILDFLTVVLQLVTRICSNRHDQPKIKLFQIFYPSFLFETKERFREMILLNIGMKA